jgi:hypothetical protein
MGNYYGEAGNSSFEFKVKDVIKANGGTSYCFHIDVKSMGFSAKLDDVWIDQSDVLEFADELLKLGSGSNIQPKLIVAPDFKIIVERLDGIGHFNATFNLQNSFNKDSASISVKIETQSLEDFARELKSLGRA